MYVYKKTDGAVAEKMNIIAVVTTNLGLFLLQILHLIHQLLTEHSLLKTNSHTLRADSV